LRFVRTPRATSASATPTHRDVLDAPAPVLAPGRAVAVLSGAWGLPVSEAEPLGSERDLNVMLDGRYVLKLSNPAEDRAVVEMENAAMAHAARVAVDLPLPALVPAASGEPVVEVADDTGRTCLARLVTVLPGAAAEGRPVTLELAGQIGALAARTSLALQGLFHPAGGRTLDWDVRQAPRVLGEAGALDGLGPIGGRLRGLLPRLTAAAEATSALPAGLNHADVTLTNILTTTTTTTDGSGPDGGPDGGLVTGLIDFGDLHHTAHVCDLAATLTSVLRNTAEEQPAGGWDLAGAVLAGYQRHRPLTRPEVEVLGDLVLARLALTLAISRRRSAVHEDNLAYINQYDASTRRALDQLLEVGPDAVTRRLHRLAGTGRSAPPAPHGQRIDEPDDPGRAGLLERRRAATGGALSPLFYADPIEVVRGEGPWLYAADGTRYLDAYNNVAVVGHAHPTVVGSVSRQLAVLNTHSRYLHGGIVELAERLLATMPEPLDTCLFTTSGTEANELAWRMATACTGGSAAVIAERAYHGSSRWMADLSPNEWPPGHRPPHVATFAAPRPSTGGTDHRTAADRIDAASARLGEQGDRPALVLADLGFTSEGVLDAPPDFVAGLVDGAHAAGALFLADEVQSGFGRVGPAFWRFAAAGVVPDLVTLGKPMGAGYPIGALITRRDIADRLARDYEYFSTFAASAVAAAAGLAVLDVLEDEHLPERVVPVGDHLRDGLRELARRDARLGEVRGRGLVAGLDLVGPSPSGDRAARRSFARALVEALRRRHVLAGLTGPDGTVLKVRPPLVWQNRHADLFVASLAAALAAVPG
jgi:4-aminobutyrate aminotransferase-like enzyme/Ser/Thr protein kinase RdoA (MazF antagonist)